MTRPGSFDDLMDIVDKLDETDLAYVLMIGRPGESKVRIFGNAHQFECENAEDGLETMEAAFPAYCEMVRKEMEEDEK